MSNELVIKIGDENDKEEHEKSITENNSDEDENSTSENDNADEKSVLKAYRDVRRFLQNQEARQFSEHFKSKVNLNIKTIDDFFTLLPKDEGDLATEDVADAFDELNKKIKGFEEKEGFKELTAD